MAREGKLRNQYMKERVSKEGERTVAEERKKSSNRGKRKVEEKERYGRMKRSRRRGRGMSSLIGDL
jgi:hypothetical protein